jgi:hypothetical protein
MDFIYWVLQVLLGALIGGLILPWVIAVCCRYMNWVLRITGVDSER